MALFGKIFTKDKKSAQRGEGHKHTPRAAASSESTPQAERLNTTRVSFDVSGVLIRPHTTEKTALLAHTGAYVFAVAKDANKHTVALAVEARYGVKVERVRITRTHEKMRRRGRQIGWKAGIKKAIVQLASGHKIETTV